VVTNAGAPAGMIDHLRSVGVEVLIAEDESLSKLSAA
jgi:hypothetical protein